MSSALISRSPDLRRLRDEGYEIEVLHDHLIVRGVPYVNAQREVVRGILFSDLLMAGDVTAPATQHVAWWVGGHPCDKDGHELTAIKHNDSRRIGDLASSHAFSNKPPGGHGYPNYYAKMTRYIEIISAPAVFLDPSVSAKTFKPVPATEEESVFRYLDTASSRAGITAVSQKLGRGRIAIVGLGGTGSYILDFAAKTHVPEIHLYDGDLFLNHNAFRAPGAASLEELQASPTKVAYHAEMHNPLRRGIFPHAVYVNEENVHELLAYDLVFLAMDAGPAKRLIMETLQAAGKTFIDAGIGMMIKEDRAALFGTCRVTTSTAEQHEHVKSRVSVAANDGDDLYSRNIQVVELNAICGALAVLKWKKLWGFYLDDDCEHDTTYTTNFNLLTSTVNK